VVLIADKRQAAVLIVSLHNVVSAVCINRVVAVGVRDETPGSVSHHGGIVGLRQCGERRSCHSAPDNRYNDRCVTKHLLNFHDRYPVFYHFSIIRS
jgi:hypothetical protein